MTIISETVGSWKSGALHGLFVHLLPHLAGGQGHGDICRTNE